MHTSQSYRSNSHTSFLNQEPVFKLQLLPLPPIRRFANGHVSLEGPSNSIPNVQNDRCFGIPMTPAVNATINDVEKTMSFYTRRGCCRTTFQVTLLAGLRRAVLDQSTDWGFVV